MQPSAQRPAWVLIVLAAVGAGLFLGFVWLGVWQLERRIWKLDLIERVTQRIGAPPVAAPAPSQWPQVSAEQYEYLPVRLSGQWLQDKTLLAQATTALGGGFWVMTPLAQANGAQVLVNRGFVPQAQRAQWMGRAATAPGGNVTVVGVLRMTEPRGGFLRLNAPAEQRWHSRDIAAMASALQLPVAAPFFVDVGVPSLQTGNAPELLAASAGPWPRSGLTVVQFPNSHLVYAITWFGLAVMTLGGAALVARYERRKRANGYPAVPAAAHASSPT